MAVKPGAKPQYGEVVARLQAIVEELEGGELSLEASLERFQEGIGLVKTGEGLLAQAEKRIEQLLSEDGKTAPLTVEAAAPPAQAPKLSAAPAAQARRPNPADDDDVPF